MNPFAELLRNLGPVRLAALGGTAIAVMGFFIFLASRLSTGSMALLYSDLDPSDSAAIVQQLEAQNIPYQIKGGGRAIHVPSDNVLKLRVKMAGQGIPNGGSMGYEIFDKSQGLGTTNFVQNVNLVRALEGELSRTIASMNSVRGSRVHLVLPRRQLFSRDRQKPSASVVLQVVGAGRMPREQVLAIQHLVAAAVPNMDPAKVAVLDSRGQLLARGDGDDNSSMALRNAQEMRVAYENRVRRSIEAMVERVVGFGRVRAEVTADVDYDRIQESKEEYDPDSQVARSTQNVTENQTSSEGVDNQNVSIENNLPETEGQNAAAERSEQQSNRTEDTVNFEISKTITQRTKETGVVRKLSIAVLVDGNYSLNNDDERVYEPRSEAELDKIATLVQSASGYNAERGDTVEVVNMQFVKLEPVDLDEGSFLFGITKEEFLELAEVLVLAVVGLLVILLVIRPVLTRLFETMPSALAGAAAASIPGESSLAQLAGPGASADVTELLEAEDEEEDSLLDQMIDIGQVEGRVRASSLKKIGEIIDNHPEEAVAIVRNWMYQESQNPGNG